MNKRILLASVSLLSLVYCGGATTDASHSGDDGGPDAMSSGGSGGGSSSGTNSSSGSGGSSGSTSSGGSSGSSGGPLPDGACPSKMPSPGGDGGPPVPADHRATAAACSPSMPFCSPADAGGGGQACVTSTDCNPDTGTFDPYTVCLHGHCAVDNCLTDSDCAASEICSCSAGHYGGNACVHRNVCVPAPQCHVDSDCGPGGFCSPNIGYCGSVQGYYCHKPTDPCIDPQADCACPGSSGGIASPAACVYEPTVGKFVCAPASICAG